jgi:KUP system potassium uptake protein
MLFGLFAVQKRGTGGIGKFFGPITLVWFMAIAVLGVSPTSCLTPRNPVGDQPALRAGVHVFPPGTTFIILGAVVLCVTGGEALYADLGHFGKKPIRLAWFPWSCRRSRSIISARARCCWRTRRRSRTRSS